MSDRRETLADVYDAYRSDRAFDSLRAPHGTILVPGEGSSRPKVLIVGEAPGATENTAKRPFAGHMGRVLRSLIADVAGLNPTDYFLTNTVKYRPAGNRPPTLEEAEASRPYLRREYAALGYPPVLISVGGVAWGALRPESHRLAGMNGIAGTPVDMPGGKALWPMVAPSRAIRDPHCRPSMENAWERFGDWFEKEFG